MENKRLKAFTLIELLVVISIIAVLMSIMMPALSKAREQARKVVCASNQKQWHIVLFMYSESYNRILPPFDDYQIQNIGNSIAGWPARTSGQVRDELIKHGLTKEVLYCPSDYMVKEDADGEKWNEVAGPKDAVAFGYAYVAGSRYDKISNTWKRSPIKWDEKAQYVVDGKSFKVSAADRVLLTDRMLYTPQNTWYVCHGASKKQYGTQEDLPKKSGINQLNMDGSVNFHKASDVKAMHHSGSNYMWYWNSKDAGVGGH